MDQLLEQLVLGSAMVILAVATQAYSIALAFRIHLHLRQRLGAPRITTFSLLVSGASLWLLAGQSVGVWLWALALIQVGAFADLEPALYYALSAYTTLGFGDLIPPDDWRVFGALIGANGMLAFGLGAAALVELVKRIGQRVDP